MAVFYLIVARKPEKDLEGFDGEARFNEEFKRERGIKHNSEKFDWT